MLWINTALRHGIVFAALLFLLHSAPASAKYASLILDADTGEIFHASHIDDRNHPASLTKIMTLYLLFDDLDAGRVHLWDRFRVSAHAASQAPSKLDLSPGENVMVQDLILAIVTKSANDAAVTVAENLNGTEALFADRMTRKARELGMRVSEFRNASGLPNPRQISSARDMATLARALLHNHAKYYHYFSTKQFTYEGSVMNNHNHLMERYEGMDGIKTGYVAASGFNLVASSKRYGRRLIGVVFGGTSAVARDQHMANLLDAAFTRVAGGSRTTRIAVNDKDDADQTTEDNESEATPSPPTATRLAKPNKVVKAKTKTVRRTEESDDDSDDDDWSIQLGSFSHQRAALTTAKSGFATLGRLVSDGDPKVIKTKKNNLGTTLWQARIVGLSEEKARQSCRRLSKAHKPCRVIKAET